MLTNIAMIQNSGESCGLWQQWEMSRAELTREMTAQFGYSMSANEIAKYLRVRRETVDVSKFAKVELPGHKFVRYSTRSVAHWLDAITSVGLF
ncbi:MAG: hypothetical protein LBN12_03480 [Clostridiales Family XIII bacterium]|jgi:hypothetical protein|nr:hypothetical protein [Clostridiales Family XIII bacterium]